jgi:hypothetical protein
VALIELKKLVNHGEWGSYLRGHCELNERTAQVYMQLAEHRTEIEAKAQHAADLTLRGALKLIGKPSSHDTSDKRGKSAKASTPLSSLAWSEATADQQQHFVNAIGMDSWLEAIPKSWRPELERRVVSHKHQKASKFNGHISAALRQALSMQKVAKDKNVSALGVASALNMINNLLAENGVDLNNVIGLVIDVNATKANAKTTDPNPKAA